MDLQYVITPFCAWLVAGIAKFIINSIRARRWALDLIGYGGLPSNHMSIVSSAAMIIGLKEGIDSPALVVALALAFIVMLDASSLRRQIGKHAEAINKLYHSASDTRAETQYTSSIHQQPLRERMGHSVLEIIAGIITGCMVAALIYCCIPIIN